MTIRERLCTECGAKITRKSKTGRCSPCALRGPNNPNWSGDKASVTSKRQRAQRWIALPEKCSRCDAPPTIRHHLDENPGNNIPSNIETLCQSCHMILHGPNNSGNKTSKTYRRRVAGRFA